MFRWKVRTQLSGNNEDTSLLTYLSKSARYWVRSMRVPMQGVQEAYGGDPQGNPAGNPRPPTEASGDDGQDPHMQTISTDQLSSHGT